VQVPTPTGADALLRAQAAAYQLVFAIQLWFLLAMFAAARTLGRPGMRAYSIVYALQCLAGIFSAFSVQTRLGDGAALLHDVTLAASLCSLAAVWGVHQVAADAMAGVPSPVPRSRTSLTLRAALLAIGGVAFALLAPVAHLPGVLGAVLKSGAPRPVILLLMLWCAIDAWRRGAATSRNRSALRLVALSFGVLVLRQAYGLYAVASAYWGEPAASEVVTFLQTSTTVLNGVALLAALMLEERSEMALQAERKRAIELRLARTQRLESLGRMAGGIAHDFANVLMVIQSEVESARESRDIGAIDAHLEDAENALARATGLTRQLGLFARQRPPEVTSFLVVDRLTLMEPVLRRLTGTAVAFEIDTTRIDDATIEMDASQFDQIFLNLVVNARDAMPNGGTLQIRAEVLRVERASSDVLWDRFETVPTDRVVSIAVSDTGSGIPEDVLDRIFEPFYSTKGDRGTGLGLATVFSVVRTANGAVGVRSQIGEGSTFVVQLPLVAEPTGIALASR
jgi:signal transduction histidine kinase